MYRNRLLHLRYIPVHPLDLIDVDLSVLRKDTVGTPLHQAVKLAHGNQVFKAHLSCVVGTHPPLDFPVQPSSGLHGRQIGFSACSIVQISGTENKFHQVPHGNADLRPCLFHSSDSFYSLLIVAQMKPSCKKEPLASLRYQRLLLLSPYSFYRFVLSHCKFCKHPVELAVLTVTFHGQNLVQIHAQHAKNGLCVNQDAVIIDIHIEIALACALYKFLYVLCCIQLNLFCLHFFHSFRLEYEFKV